MTATTPEMLVRLLTYNQGLALKELQKNPEPKEATEFCKKVDMSWMEMYRLSERGLVQIDCDTKAKRLYIQPTELGNGTADKIDFISN